MYGTDCKIRSVVAGLGRRAILGSTIKNIADLALPGQVRLRN